ncbi:MAG: M28 family peptidase [Planctomycetota bacterium]|nr:M28 family peptidase [Planctomycetota bacterium]
MTTASATAAHVPPPVVPPGRVLFGTLPPPPAPDATLSRPAVPPGSREFVLRTLAAVAFAAAAAAVMPSATTGAEPLPETVGCLPLLAPDMDRIRKHVEYFASLGSRLAGSRGCDLARLYIADRLRDGGVDAVGFYEFQGCSPIETECRMVIRGGPFGETGRSVRLHGLWPNGVRTPKTPPGGICGHLVYAGTGELRELDGIRLRGAIALMEFESRDRWRNAAMFGAKAAVFIEPGEAERTECEAKYIYTPLDFPRYWIGRDEGLRLREMLARTAARLGTAGASGESGAHDTPRASGEFRRSGGAGTSGVVGEAGGAGTAGGAGESGEAGRTGRAGDAGVSGGKGGGHAGDVGKDGPAGTEDAGLSAEIYCDMTWVRRPWFNVWGLLRGTAPRSPGDASGSAAKLQPVVLGAYYDSISVAPALAPGAQQSLGAAVLLEAARLMAANRPARDVLFVFTTGHFMSLAGARHLFAVWTGAEPILSDEKLDEEIALFEDRLAVLAMMRRLALEAGRPGKDEVFAEAAASDLRLRFPGRLRETVEFNLDGLKDRLGREEGSIGARLRAVREGDLKASDAAGLRERLTVLDMARAYLNGVKPGSRGTFPESAWPAVREILEKAFDEQAAWERAALQEDIEEKARRLRNQPFEAIFAGRLKPAVFLALDLSAGGDGIGMFARGDLLPIWDSPVEASYRNFGSRAIPLMRAVEKEMGYPPGRICIDTLLESAKRPWRSYVLTEMARESEPGLCARVRSLVFETARDLRPLADSPHDDLAAGPGGRPRLEWSRVAPQAKFCINALARLCADPRLTEDAALNLPRTGFAQAHGKAVRRGGSASAFARIPVEGALVGPCLWKKVCAGVRGAQWEMSDVQGRIRILCYRFFTWNPSEAYRTDPETGEINMAANLKVMTGGDINGHWGVWVNDRKKEFTVELFECRGIGFTDLVDPRFLTNLTTIRLLDARTESQPRQFGASIFTWADPCRVVFVPPYGRYKVLMGHGTFGVRMSLLGVSKETFDDLRSRDLDFIEARHAIASGEGIPASAGIMEFLPFAAARDMWALDESRIKALKRRAIENRRIEDLHDSVYRRLMEAQEALGAAGASAGATAASIPSSPRYSEAWEKATAAWGLESRAYPEVRETADDAVLGVVFYMMLMLPFCFFVERLLFAFPKLERQLSAFLLIFLAMFLILRLVHPAFDLVASPMIILLAFVILVLAGIVMAIVYGKFNAEMRALQAGMTAAAPADVNRVSATAVAVALGINQMRRRPVRTGLTCLTVVFITFACLSFTSVVRSVESAWIELPHEAPYEGFLYREMTWGFVPPRAYEIIRAKCGDGAIVAPRAWLSAPPWRPGEKRYVDISCEAGGRRREITASSAMGMTADEPAITGADRALVRGRWFEPAEKDALILPAEAAAALRIAAEEVPGAEMRIGGRSFRVVGIFDPAKMDALTDLDGEPLSPADFSKSQGTATIGDDYTKTQVGLESLELLATARYEHFSSAGCVILPFETLMDMGASIRSVAAKAKPGVNLMSNVVPDLLRRMEKNLYVGVAAEAAGGPEAGATGAGMETGPVRPKARLYSCAGRLSVTGLRNLLVPLLIAALIVLNTMLGAVYERGREIAVFTALGLAPSHVGALFLAESAVYAVLGGVSGYLMGQGVAKALATWGAIQGLTLNYSSFSAVMVTVIVMGVVLASSLYPSWLAGRASAPSVERKWRVPAPRPEDIRLGALAIRYGFCREEDVERAAALQASDAGAAEKTGAEGRAADGGTSGKGGTEVPTGGPCRGRRKPIGQWLVETGALTQHGLEELLAMQRKLAPEAARRGPAEIRIEMPFSFSREHVPGIVMFLHDWTAAHGEATLGRFCAAGVRLEPLDSPRGRGVRLSFMCHLVPYDLGVSQEVRISFAPDADGIFAAGASFHRVSGFVSSWVRANGPFLNELRKRFLLWRAYSPRQRTVYSAKGFHRFREVLEPAGWTAPPEAAGIAAERESAVRTGAEAGDGTAAGQAG